MNFLAAEFNMESVAMEQIDPPTEEVISLFQPAWARQYEAFPIGVNSTEVEVVFGNPLDEDGLENLSHLLGKAIYPKVAYRGAVLKAIDDAYGTAEERKMSDFFEGMDPKTSRSEMGLNRMM